MSDREILIDHTVDARTRFVSVDCAASFQAATPTQRKYAHHLACACWLGALACPFQVSPEAPVLLVLLQKLFRHETPDELQRTAVQMCGFTDEQFDQLMLFMAAFYKNLGNYFSLGDKKFVPSVPKDLLDRLFANCAAAKADPVFLSLWIQISSEVMSLSNERRYLGYPPACVTTYLSGNCTAEDARGAQAFLDSQQLSAYNSRLFKRSDGVMVIRLASAEVTLSPDSVYAARLLPLVHRTHTLTLAERTFHFELQLGDYAPILRRVCEHLAAAIPFAANDTERQMLRCYVEAFRWGSMDAHKDLSRLWVANKQPAVETYIGFIESYRDPAGARGEWESLVGFGDRQQAARLQELVRHGADIVGRLPWPAAFEKDHYLNPDFGAIDVLAYATTGSFIGKNNPNYNEIRQNEGFKNVLLGNMMRAQWDPLSYLVADADGGRLSARGLAAKQLHVALHELFGHGTGKLLSELPDGGRNFDPHLVNPLTGAPVASCYEPHDTYQSRFGALSSTLEECRAEAVALYLAAERDVLLWFGYGDVTAATEAVELIWLHLLALALAGLEHYSPASRRWGQAHSRGRFVILRTLLNAQSPADQRPLVSVDLTDTDTPTPRVCLRMNFGLIDSVGRVAIATLLLQMQVYKSTADVSGAQQLFEQQSDVDAHWLEVRRAMLATKPPRRLVVVCNTELPPDADDVRLIGYDATAAGLVNSFLDRFARLRPPADAELLESELLQLSAADRHFFHNYWPV